jgi:hypothetical protein
VVGLCARGGDERQGCGSDGCVACKLSALKFTREPDPAVDGDAAFLEIGTKVYSIKGFAPRCRVAVKDKGLNRVYVAVSGAGGTPSTCGQQ